MKVRCIHVCWCAVAALILGHSASAVNGANGPANKTLSSGSTAASTPSTAQTDPDEWEIQIRLLLDMLCYLIGCDQRSNDIQSTVAGFIATYDANGVDPGLTPQQRAQALSDTLDAIDLAEIDPGVLPASLRADLLASLNGMALELNN